MARFRAQAEHFGARVIDVEVDRVDFSSRPFRAWAEGVEYRGDAVIVATGASALWLGLESEERLRGHGVSACATCDASSSGGKEIAVVGGGGHRHGGGALPDPLRDEGPPPPPPGGVPGQPDHGGARGAQPADRRSIGTSRSRRSSATRRSRACGSATRRRTPVRSSRSRPLRRHRLTGPTRGRSRAGSRKDEGRLPGRPFGDALADRGGLRRGDVHDHRYRQAVTAAGDGCRAAIDRGALGSRSTRPRRLRRRPPAEKPRPQRPDGVARACELGEGSATNSPRGAACARLPDMQLLGRPEPPPEIAARVPVLALALGVILLAVAACGQGVVTPSTIAPVAAGATSATASGSPSGSPAPEPVASPSPMPSSASSVGSGFPGGFLIADRGNGRLLAIDRTGKIWWRFPTSVAGAVPAGQSFAADDAFLSPDGLHDRGGTTRPTR